MAQNYVDVLVRGRDQGAKPELDDLRVKLNDLQGRVAEARALVDDEAAAAKLDDLQAKLLRLDKTTARPKITMDQAVRAESQIHALEAVFADFGQKADAATQKAGKDLDELGAKAKQTAKSAGDGMSPLLVSAFTVAAAAGPAALLAGTSAAIVGVGALVTKNNQQLTSSYQALASDASAAITRATAPLVPSLQKSVDILDQGIARAEPQLAALFSAAGPEATALVTGISDLANNALPGMVSGLRAAAPYSKELAADLGELGTGASGFLTGLASGAAGGAEGLHAIVDAASHLLADVGQVTGSLANGLGPALHDVETVAVPVADALTDVVKAIPPQAITTAAVATTALFAAFKVSALTGLLTEGATFLTFLRGEAVAATEAATATGMLARAQSAAAATTGAMTAATSAALGPYGLLAGVTLMATNELSKLTHVTLDPITAFNQLKEAEDAHNVSAEKTGTTISAAAKAIGTYAKGATQATTSANALTSALSIQATSAQQSAQQTADKTLADLGATDGSDKLTVALQGEITAFEEANTQTSAYKTVLDATFGKYQTYSDAVAGFTTQLSSANGQLTHGRQAIDLHSAAGAKNYQILSGLATQNSAVAQALLTQTGDQDKANKALQAGAVQIDNLAKKAGFTSGQIATLNKDLYGTASIGDIKVTVTADTSRVYEGVSGALHWIDSTSATIPVNYAGPAHAGYAHGGVIGGIGTAATGGARGALTMIDEQGPEIVRLPSGSMVMSHPDTDRYLSQQASAGPAAVELELVASDDLFLRWLRNAIRVRGGDVQKVLGPAR